MKRLARVSSSGREAWGLFGINEAPLADHHQVEAAGAIAELITDMDPGDSWREFLTSQQIRLTF